MGRKTKSELNRLENDFNSIHTKRINSIMVTCEDEDFAVLYMKLMEYYKPKLQRSEIIEDAKEQVITIKHVRAEDEKTGD